MQKTIDTKDFIARLDPYETKCSMARKFLEQFALKFSQTVDGTIFKELDRLVAFLEPIFINQRSAQHLSKLAFSIYFIRRKLSRNMAHFPFKDHFDIRVFPSFLHFAFSTKTVLSILTHAYLKDKYEVFEEEQILFLIRKIVPEAQLIRDSIYTFQPSKNTVKSLYFEVDKKSGHSFSFEEIKQLKELLNQEIKFSVERLVPRVFMIRNEEEILKNILTLNREIRVTSDLPQVMILLDQQTAQEALFTVILIRVLKPGLLSIEDTLKKKQLEGKYIFERAQIVRYLRKTYPIEANVFRIKLTKDPSILRIDRSLNFYLARNKISQILIAAVGEFRDYNGGIILTQREILSSFRERFPDLSDSDLIENFYYSISPIEAQATLLLETLESFFRLFLQARAVNFAKSSDFFFKTQITSNEYFTVIRTPDETVKGKIDLIFADLGLSQKMITFFQTDKNTYFLGYLLINITPQAHQQLSDAILETLETWKKKVESRQVFKIGIEHPVVSLDPRIGGDQVSSLILKMLFEGLMRLDQNGELEKGIAQEVEVSSDQKTYLFKLRQTLWSDGSQVTAYDFEYAWKKVLSPSFKTPFAYFFYPIKNAKLAKHGSIGLESVGIKALDALTLEVELLSPSPYFLELTSHPLYSPINRSIDQQHPNWPFEDKESYICNGAFKLRKNSANGEGYKLIKNTYYWDIKNIKLDEVVILKTNRHHAYEMFQNELIDWIGAPLGEPNFIPRKIDDCINFCGTVIYWFVLNTQQFPFNNKKIRQSLAWSLQRDALQEKCQVLPAISPLPLIHSQISPSDLPLHTLEDAKNLFKEGLQELNLTLEDFPKIPLMYLISAKKARITQFIKEQWENTFGITCVLEPVEWKTLFPRLAEGDFLAGGISWEPWINDSIYTLNAFRDGKDPINFPKWENRQYQKIMLLAEKEFDLTQRKAYYLQAEKILLEEMPVIPIFLMESAALKRKNFHIHCSSPFLNFKWGFFS